MTTPLWSFFPFQPNSVAEVLHYCSFFNYRKVEGYNLGRFCYIVDRLALEDRGVPVIGGIYLATKYGPVAAQVLSGFNLVKRKREYLADKAQSYIAATWKKFVNMSELDYAKWTKEIPEYKTGGLHIITLESMGYGAGLKVGDVEKVLEWALSSGQVDKLLSTRPQAALISARTTYDNGKFLSFSVDRPGLVGYGDTEEGSRKDLQLKLLENLNISTPWI